MSSLYNIVYEFWTFWFNGSTIDTSVFDLLSVITTIALVFGILIFPILKLFRGRRK